MQVFPKVPLTYCTQSLNSVTAACKVTYKKFLFCPKQTINSSIHKLEKEGYISFSDGKGRSKHINLTPTGKLLIQEKIYPIVKCENNSFSSLNKDEQKLLLSMCKKYIISLHNEFNKLNE